MSGNGIKIVNPVSKRMVKPIKTVDANMPQRTIQMQYDKGWKGFLPLLCFAPNWTDCYAFVWVLTAFSLRLHWVLSLFKTLLMSIFLQSGLLHIITFSFLRQQKCILMTDKTNFTHSVVSLDAILRLHNTFRGPRFSKKFLDWNKSLL